MTPLKKMKQKEIGLQERPWINRTILAAMFERDNLHKDFLEESNPILRLEKHKFYKAKRNLVTSQLRKAKREYFNTFFEQNQNNIKETWKGIRNLINVSKKSSSNINKLIENGKEITNPSEMAEILNKFYVNIRKTVEKKYQWEIRHFYIMSMIEIHLVFYSIRVQWMKSKNIFLI